MKESYNKCVAANTLHRADLGMPYAYDANPSLCHISAYDFIYDYDDTRCISGITSSTWVTTTFRGDAGFAGNDGVFSGLAAGGNGYEQEPTESGMPLYQSCCDDRLRNGRRHLIQSTGEKYQKRVDTQK